jgi:hypothetical protein
MGKKHHAKRHSSSSDEHWGEEITLSVLSPAGSSVGSAKRCRADIGGLDDRAWSVFALPRGPTSKRELIQWPLAALQKICSDPERGCRLQSMLSIGFDVDSDYSGWASEREIVRRLDFALCDHGFAWTDSQRPRFHHHRTCYNDADAQSFLLYTASNSDASRSHVMDGIKNNFSCTI